jgi:DNA adenine methylase
VLDTHQTQEAANIRPFLRWAGSKRRLLAHLIPFIPKSYGKYFEPFLGGGSMFFYLGPQRAEISDASEPLIETYRAVSEHPDQLLKFLRALKPNKATFNRLRQYAPRSRAGLGGQFIFLNKSCWNGLYRVNSSGIFNVPFGWPKTDHIIDEENLRLCSKQLRRRSIAIKHQDFGEIESRVSGGDFVFLDPPYVTSHNMNGFVDWNECLFSWKDQVRLADMARRLVRKKANVLITNAAHSDLRALYSDFGQAEFNRYSTLASDTSRRRATSEAIFFAGPAYSKPAAPSIARGRSNGSHGRVSRSQENPKES